MPASLTCSTPRLALVGREGDLRVGQGGFRVAGPKARAGQRRSGLSYRSGAKLARSVGQGAALGIASLGHRSLGRFDWTRGGRRARTGVRAQSRCPLAAAGAAARPCPGRAAEPAALATFQRCSPRDGPSVHLGLRQRAGGLQPHHEAVAPGQAAAIGEGGLAAGIGHRQRRAWGRPARQPPRRHEDGRARPAGGGASARQGVAGFTVNSVRKKDQSP